MNNIDKYASRRKWINPSGTKIYFVWRNMQRRCFDKNDENYFRYGGRGISICKEWLSYDNFFNDMSRSYRVGLTLDRINVNKNYEPNNCRWISVKEQQNNKRINVRIENNGETKTIAEWCDFLGLSKAETSRAYKRFNKYGAVNYEEIFTNKRLLSKRVDERSNKCKICGRTESCYWYCAGTICNNCAQRAMRLRRKHKKNGISLLTDLESYCNLIRKMETVDDCNNEIK